jgi:hypothetical protein
MIREANARTETRDAILWAVYPDQRYATVRIQGSSVSIPANFPENWEQTPVWLKPGNAVKIMHTGGNRNRVELVGHGLAVPTPVDGSASAPTLEAGPDTVLTGMQIRPVTNSELMQVWVDQGTYRADNTTYLFEDSLVMTADSDITLGSAVYGNALMAMGTIGNTLEVEAAHATAFRYDIFSVGSDGILTYTKGTAHATDPQFPDTPSGHALVGWVLLPPGTTAITSDLINRYYIEPFVSQMTASPEPLELDWETSSGEITIELLDQYGNGIGTQRWDIYAEVVTGTGTVDSRKTLNTWGSTGNYSASFTYTRVADYDDEVSPVSETAPVFIEFTLSQADVTHTTLVILYNEGGEIISGTT